MVSQRTRDLLVALGAVLVAGVLASPNALRAQQLVSLPTPDGGRVEADLYGAGDRGVVLAHGGRFDKSSWKTQARALADAGFRVLAIDFRAAAESRAGRESACLYDESCLAVDVLAAVRYLAEPAPGKCPSLGQASAAAPPLKRQSRPERERSIASCC